MKTAKISFAVLVAVLMAMGIATQSQAFHSGGVAECDGCHTMHNSEGGTVMKSTGGLTQYTAGPYLLQGSTQSEVCLNCHEHAGDTGPSSYHISTAASDVVAGTAPPKQRTPGGDFGWLRTTYSFLVRGTATTNEGEHRGHNINAPANTYNAASNSAPGGTYPGASLQCSSCHDPHGKFRRNAAGAIVDGTALANNLPIVGSGSYSNSTTPSGTDNAVGVYRLLGGVGYSPKSTPGYGFVNGPPTAVAPATYNRTESANQTRVAYGKGMSEWCANCHGQIFAANGLSDHRHPASNAAKFTTNVPFSNYNQYVKSGDLSGTFTALQGPYTSLVPFEEGVADDTPSTYTTLKGHAKIDGSYLTGADANSTVMCLSCHRAHASGFQFMLRFAHENELMTIADASGTVAAYDGSTTEGKINRGLSVLDQTAAYYDRPATVFSPYQRLLCNKCHAKD